MQENQKSWDVVMSHESYFSVVSLALWWWFVSFVRSECLVATPVMSLAACISQGLGGSACERLGQARLEEMDGSKAQRHN